MLQYNSRLTSVKENFIDEWQLGNPQTDALASDSINTISSAIEYWAQNAGFESCHKDALQFF